MIRAWQPEPLSVEMVKTGLLLFGGRLTLTTGVPLTVTDVTGAGTLYYTPYFHNRVSVFDGTRWKIHTFTERSLALTLTSGKNYDVFLYDNAGTLTLELSAAWTNDTTRADALTTQDGVQVKSGATTRLWLGTIRASGANTTEDSGGGATTQVGGKRYVWNAYNRVRRWMSVFDSTITHTYATLTWRQFNAAAGNKCEYVCGALGESVSASAYGPVQHTGVNFVAHGIGVDSTTVNSAVAYGTAPQGTGTMAATGMYVGNPGLGYHALNWLQISTTGGTVTWYSSAGVETERQSAMLAEVWA